jgi:tRNA nucleotidyltransferase (CCA-adding enzyme)
MKVITTHKNPDFDAIASCIAAKKIYEDAYIMFPKLPERSTKNFIIQSIIYPYLNNGDIKIDDIDTMIIVDTHSSKRIESRFADILNDVYKICYDHHEEGDIDCDVCHFVKFGANVTQMVDKIIKKDIPIDESEATLFMLGIYEDTGKLSYSSTTPKDIFISAKLLEAGADLDTIRSVLEEVLSEIDVLLLNDIIKNKRIYEINNKRIGLSFTSADEYINNVANLVNKLITIDNLDAAICIFRMASRIYVIGRSKDEDINVAKIIKDVGGGGHPQAASATIKDMTLIEVAEKLSYSIKMNVLHSIKAKDIMSFPVKFVYSDDTLKKVNDVISKSGMNALVVLDRSSGEVVGIITRQIINKATYHHMEDESIAMFMNTEFKEVNENEIFDNIKGLVLDENQRIIPVLSDRNELVGVITRTNILKLLSDDAKNSEKDKLKNISSTIEKMLPMNILEYLKKAGELAKKLNYNVYMVGGIVRDIVLGHKNLDIDLVVEGDGIKFSEEFSKSFENSRVAAHDRFKTATIIFDENLKIDVATAREEYYDLPGSLPNVEESSIKLDLYRRDFTINTLAVKLHDNFGDLLDFFGGLKDIKEKKIRVLHMLSFIEDPTRMFRAIRFSAKLGFEIGKQTDRLIKIAVELEILKHIERIRIFNEIKHILESNCVKCSFEMIKKYKLLSVLDKKFIIDDRILGYLDKQERIADKCLMVCKGKKIRIDLIYMILFEYLYRKSFSFADTVGADEKTKKLTKENAYRLPSVTRVINKKDSTNYDIYQSLNSLSIEGVLVLYALYEDNKRIADYFEYLIDLKPIIRGKDLLALGFKPSKIFSVIINDVFKQQLLNKIKDKSQAIDYIKHNYSAYK